MTEEQQWWEDPRKSELDLVGSSIVMRPGFVKVQVMLGLVAVILITSALITHNTVLYNKSFKRCHPLREGILVLSHSAATTLQ